MSGFTSSDGGGGSSSSSTSSSIGGGSSTYSNKSGDFVATTTSGAKTIVFSSFASTVLSSVLTVESFANAIIKRISSAGAVDSLPMTTISWASGTSTLTLSDMTANFADGDTVEVFITGPEKAYDKSNDVRKTVISDGTNSATITFAGGIGMLGARSRGIYNSSKPTVVTGNYTDLQTNINGALDVNEAQAPGYENNSDGIAWTHPKPITSATSAITIDKSTALEASTVTKATAGRLYAADVRVDSTLATGTYYIQWFNNSSLPADSAGTLLIAPTKVQHVSGTDDLVEFNWVQLGGLYCSTGIVMCISTTEFSKTIGGAFTSSNVYYA